MSWSTRHLKGTTPSLFSLADASTREAIDRQVSQFLKPLLSVFDRLELFARDMASGGEGFVSEAELGSQDLEPTTEPELIRKMKNSHHDPHLIRQTLFGLLQTNWPLDVMKRMIPRYIEYTRFRGTPRGLQILLKAFLGDISFEVKERSFPADFFVVGESRMGSGARACEDVTSERSLSLRLYCNRQDLGDQRIVELRELLTAEVMTGCQVYLVFEDSQVSEPQLRLSEALVEYWRNGYE